VIRATASFTEKKASKHHTETGHATPRLAPIPFELFNQSDAKGASPSQDLPPQAVSGVAAAVNKRQARLAPSDIQIDPFPSTPFSRGNRAKKCHQKHKKGDVPSPFSIKIFNMDVGKP